MWWQVAWNTWFLFRGTQGMAWHVSLDPTPHSTPAWGHEHRSAPGEWRIWPYHLPPTPLLLVPLFADTQTNRLTDIYVHLLLCLLHSEVCSSTTFSSFVALSLCSACPSSLSFSLKVSMLPSSFSPPPSLPFLSFPYVLYMGLYSFHSNTLLTFLQPPWCVVLGGHVALKDIAHLRDISPSSTHVQIPCGTHPTHLTHPTPHSYIWHRSCFLPPSILLSIFPSILPSFTCIALICLLPPYFLFFFFFFLLSLVIVSTPDRCFVVLLKRQASLFVPHRLCFSHPLLITQQSVPLSLWRVHKCTRWAGLVTAFGNHFSFLSSISFGQSAVPASLSCLLSLAHHIFLGHPKDPKAQFPSGEVTRRWLFQNYLVLTQRCRFSQNTPIHHVHHVHLVSISISFVVFFLLCLPATNQFFFFLAVCFYLFGVSLRCFLTIHHQIIGQKVCPHTHLHPPLFNLPCAFMLWQSALGMAQHLRSFRLGQQRSHTNQPFDIPSLISPFASSFLPSFLPSFLLFFLLPSFLPSLFPLTNIPCLERKFCRPIFVRPAWCIENHWQPVYPTLAEKNNLLCFVPVLRPASCVQPASFSFSLRFLTCKRPNFS